MSCQNLMRLSQWRNQDFATEDLLFLDDFYAGASQAYPYATAQQLLEAWFELPSGVKLNGFEIVLVLTAHKRIHFPIDRKLLEQAALSDFEVRHVCQK